jgi:transcriptional regulator GlxA family with amidase domain
MFCVWPGIEHDFYEDRGDPWHFYWTRLEGEGAEALARSLGFSETCQVGRPREPERAIRCFQSLFEYYARRDRGDPFRAMALLFDFVSACRSSAPVQSENDTGRRLLGEARALLESLLDTGINVGGLAERLHVSRQALLAAFQNELGLTPTRYIQSTRLERAKELLATTRLKVSAVAHACGYGHTKYFHRRFRELTGQTPGSWRRHHSARTANAGARVPS